ncbi:hypothetical protein GCM10029992_17060 [Glycomyces albus]
MLLDLGGLGLGQALEVHQPVGEVAGVAAQDGVDHLEVAADVGGADDIGDPLGARGHRGLQRGELGLDLGDELFGVLELLIGGVVVLDDLLELGVALLEVRLDLFGVGSAAAWLEVSTADDAGSSTAAVIAATRCRVRTSDALLPSAAYRVS